MQSYEDLEIYKLSHKLAVEIHFETLKFPKFEMYEEGSQIRRSAKSVPSNIVEGFGRKQYLAEYVRFLIFAHASCNETIEHLKILFETKSFTDKNRYDYFAEEYDKLGRKINKFIQAVKQNLCVPRKRLYDAQRTMQYALRMTQHAQRNNELL